MKQNLWKGVFNNFWWQPNCFLLTETFTLICSAIDKHFWTNNGAERHKHLHQFAIAKLLGQVINKQITAFGSRYGASWEHQKRLINYEIPGGRVGNLFFLWFFWIKKRREKWKIKICFYAKNLKRDLNKF